MNTEWNACAIACSSALGARGFPPSANATSGRHGKVASRLLRRFHCMGVRYASAAGHSELLAVRITTEPGGTHSMNRKLTLILLLSAAGLVGGTRAVYAADCAQLAGLKLPHTQISVAETVAAGAFKLPAGAGGAAPGGPP